MKKHVAYSDLQPFLGKDKSVSICHADYESRSTLARLLKLATVFNKTVVVEIGGKKLKISKGDKLKDIVAESKELERQRIAFKPSARAIKETAKLFRSFDEGPYSGFMSG